MARMVPVLVLTCAIASSVLAQGPAPIEPAKVVVETARALAGRPNDPRLQLAMAVAYMERGKEGDAERAMGHRDRALDLDPDLTEEINNRFVSASSGFDTDAPTAEMALADMQAAATLPARGAHAGEEAMRSRLATRLAKQRFVQPSTSFAKNMEQVKAMFEDPNDTTRPSAERESAIGAAGRRGQDALTQRLVETIRQNLARREKAENRGSRSPDDPPDPMITKARAYLSLLNGDVTGAVHQLELTVSAAETIARRQLEADPEGLVSAGAPAALGRVADGPDRGAAREAAKPVADDDWGDEETGGADPGRGGTSPARVALNRTPPRTDDTPVRSDAETPDRADDPTPARADTPARVDPVTPARADTPARAGDPADQGRGGISPDRAQTSGREQGPERVQGPGGPAERTRRIGQQALEAVESTRTPELPPPDVTRKARELAAIGEVGDPLIVDIDGDGRPSLPGGLAPDGRLDERARVRFDLDGDGTPEWTEWMTAGDALVAFDLDGDGRITSGRELPGAVPGRGDAARSLSMRDLDGDGALTGRELAGCVLWKDDGDGSCEAGELSDARAAGVTELRVNGARIGGVLRTVWEWWPDVR